MERPWIVVQHVPFESPGLITEALTERGATVELCRTYLGDPVPDAAGLATPTALAGLVVMGGPMSALDDAEFPHLAAERALLRACVESDVPVLAVCLGAQLLAAALGARVFTGPEPEIGLGTVSLTEAGRRDPVFGPARQTLPVLHWHGDTFDLPAGSTLLASNAAYPHQAYRIGSAYGLQFHLELGAADLPAIEPHLPAGVRIDQRHLTLVTRAGRALFDRFAAKPVRASYSDRPLAESAP